MPSDPESVLAQEITQCGQNPSPVDELFAALMATTHYDIDLGEEYSMVPSPVASRTASPPPAPMNEDVVSSPAEEPGLDLGPEDDQVFFFRNLTNP